jgi:hypothetical protein
VRAYAADMDRSGINVTDEALEIGVISSS